MRILALDQASRVSGWAVFDDDQLETYGKIDVSKYTDIGNRLYHIRQQIQQLIEKFSIDQIVLEDIYMDSQHINNVQTFKILAEVFGVIYELCISLEKPVCAVLAGTWKSTLNIKGQTRQEQKQNAQKFICDTYKIKPTQDECDAICIGMYYTKTQDNNWGE